MANKATHRNRIRQNAGANPSWEEWISPNEKTASPGGNGHTGISELAYFLWQQRGCPHGSPEEDWFRAEAILSGQASR